MSNEVRFVDNPNPQVQALAMGENLVNISKRETWYQRAIENRNNVAPSFMYNHAMLLMAQKSLVTELELMGYTDLAYISVDIGVKQASETKRK